jgi:hypothetical protein
MRTWPLALLREAGGAPPRPYFTVWRYSPPINDFVAGPVNSRGIHGRLWRLRGLGQSLHL